MGEGYVTSIPLQATRIGGAKVQVPYVVTADHASVVETE